jgi:branched-chain amino acid transport system permease protein
MISQTARNRSPERRRGSVACLPAALVPPFAAAILGGIGSLIGAVVGGLLVGLAENLSVLVVGAGYKTAMPFLLLLLVLFFRPQGIFGQR